MQNSFRISGRSGKGRLVILLLGFALLLGGCGGGELTVEEGLQRAEDYLAEGDIEQAIRVLERLHGEHPGDLRVLEPLATNYIELGEPAKAAFYFQEIADAGPENTIYWLFAAQAHVEAGQSETAAEAYREYLDANPRDGSVWRQLGELQAEAGRPNPAIEAYSRAYPLTPSGPLALHLGQLFQQVGNAAQAFDWYERSLEHEGDHRADALLGLIELALTGKRFSEAEQRLAALDREYPGYFDVSHLAAKREELKQWRAQQEALAARLAEQRRLAEDIRRRAEEEEPAETATTEEQTADETAEAEEAAPETDTAETEAEETPPVPLAGEASEEEEAAPALPAAAQGSAQRAREAFEAGNYADAIAAWWEAINADDQPAALWYGLSRAYAASGQYGWAETTALEALRRAPEDTAVRLHFLDVVRQGRGDTAYFEELRRARQRLPENPDIALALARAYRDIRSNPRDARLLFEEFLRIAPGNHPERAAAESERSALR